MKPVVILNETALRAAVPLTIEAVDVIEGAFRALSEGEVVMPPVLSMAIKDANGEVDVKTAYLKGTDVFAIKVSPGFFDNPRIGLPSLNGLMIALSATTGVVEAVLLDNGYLTNVRTAAAGAVAARWLAPEKVDCVTVLGAGVQARLQVMAVHLVRRFEKVIVWCPNLAESEQCAEDIAKAIGVPAIAVADAEMGVRASQIVITTTPARSPILHSGWLQPGTHLTCMGSDQEDKNEIDPYVIVAADLYVCDRVTQCVSIGELRTVHKRGLMLDYTPPELGDIIAGARAGRESPSDITVCDLTGTGAQDTAIASYALRAAQAQKAGVLFSR